MATKIIELTTHNVLGLCLGTGAGFLVGKMVIKTNNTLGLVFSSVIGGVLGIIVSWEIKKGKKT